MLPTIPNYQIVRKLGMGGMGAVYEAVHQKIGRRVAIKLLHAEFAAREDIVARFLNEARAANLIRHRSIVDIYEFGQASDGSAYIIMELIEGVSLSTQLRRTRGALPATYLFLFQQVAEALSAAHKKGVIHRDIKPENIMLVADPTHRDHVHAKVLDFGIAKLCDVPLSSVEGGSESPFEFRTRTGAMMGTPAFMAPEQCRGAETVTDRADVYSLGVVLHMAFSGEAPFSASSDLDYMLKHLTQPPPRLPVGHLLSASIPDLVLRMLAKTPEDRPSMAEVADVLHQAHAERKADAGQARAMMPTLSDSATSQDALVPTQTASGGQASIAAVSTDIDRASQRGESLLPVRADSVSDAATRASKKESDSALPERSFSEPERRRMLVEVEPHRSSAAEGRVSSGLGSGLTWTRAVASGPAHRGRASVSWGLSGVGLLLGLLALQQTLSRPVLNPLPSARQAAASDRTKPPAAGAGSLAPVSGESQKEPRSPMPHLSNQAPKDPAPDAARKVRWMVSTVPPGASVELAETGQLVGLTPWQHEQEAAPGAVRFVLRLSGYQGASITLTGDRDATVHQVLLHQPPPKPLPVNRRALGGPPSVGRSSVGRPATSPPNESLRNKELPLVE